MSGIERESVWEQQHPGVSAVSAETFQTCQVKNEVRNGSDP